MTRASCEREAFYVRLSSVFSGIFSSLSLPASGRDAKFDLGLFMPLQFTLHVRLGFLYVFFPFIFIFTFMVVLIETLLSSSMQLKGIFS